MNRRDALKNMGLSAGYIVATPALINLLQSCKNEYALNWTPEILAVDEAKALDQIVDLIIPETTGSPGAKALHVPMVIDKYINHVASVEEGQLFKAGAGVILNELGVGENKTIDEVTTEEYDALLTKYLKLPKEKQQDYRRQMYEMEPSDTITSLPQEVASFNFLAAVRDLSIMGYKSSEYVGENVLAYLPVPGEQIGCAPVETLTKGKAWSL